MFGVTLDRVGLSFLHDLSKKWKQAEGNQRQPTEGSVFNSLFRPVQNLFLFYFSVSDVVK